MDDLENKTNDQLRSELHELEVNHLKLKEQLLNGWDILLAMEVRGKEVYKIINKRINGTNGI
tara:strand:- start:144 stop:329 length:186 start_codon:yes stop_codon:yes gene_type:complete